MRQFGAQGDAGARLSVIAAPSLALSAASPIGGSRYSSATIFDGNGSAGAMPRRFQHYQIADESRVTQVAPWSKASSRSSDESFDGIARQGLLNELPFFRDLNDATPIWRASRHCIT